MATAATVTRVTLWRSLSFLWASAGAGVHEAGGGPWRIRSPLRFPGIGIACGVGYMNIGTRFALVLLFALGMDPLCSLVGFSFLVGGFIAGCGFVLPFSPVGVLVDGLSVSQIHLNRRSGVVDLAAFPCCGGCRWRIWKWWLRFGLWLQQIEA